MSGVRIGTVFDEDLSNVPYKQDFCSSINYAGNATRTLPEMQKPFFVSSLAIDTKSTFSDEFDAYESERKCALLASLSTKFFTSHYRENSTALSRDSAQPSPVKVNIKRSTFRRYIERILLVCTCYKSGVVLPIDQNEFDYNS